MRFKKLLLIMIIVLAVMATCIPAGLAYDMPYYIGVDITNQIVTIYRTSDGSIVRQMLTSSGMNDCTPNGTFYLMRKVRAAERNEWLWLGQYDCFVKFATRIYRGYMFHSIPFDKKDESTMQEQAWREFGMPTSHGCLRLRVEDAKFIAKECLEGTMVKIYKSDVKQEDLRQLLLISSYTGEGGMTYSEFLGYSEDALGSGAVGTEVADLQYRLADLGYYDGPFNSQYTTDVIVAVKHLQHDLGIAETGITTPELQEVIFSENAPVSAGQITLSEGRSGPVVKKLQEALMALGLYDGELDSIYDLDVMEAVRMFQSAFGYSVDGVATAEMQHALYYQVEQLEATFGEDAIPEPEITVEEITMATMRSENNIIVRSKPNTEGKRLGLLMNGDVVILNASRDGWSSITVKGVDGFIMSKYLEPFTQKNIVLVYSADGKTEKLGHTMQEYKAGAPKASEAFATYYASEQFVSSATEMVDYVTVNTGSDDVKLNLRAEPNGESEIIAEVPNGVSLRVLAVEGDYTRVGFDDQIGYLLNDYLTTWQGRADEVESTEEAGESYVDTLAEEEGTIMAIVVLAGEDEKVEVYAEGSDDAEILGSLPVGTQVEVVNLTEVDGWVRIRYKGKEGYMPEANLQFNLMA